MGYDLIPRNKNLDVLSFGAFTFPVMLDMGIGLVIDTAPATKPGTFSYTPDKKNRCPMYNEGFYVTAKKAKAMSCVAKGLVKTLRFINEEWGKMTQIQKKECMKYEFYKKPTDEIFIKKIEAFSEWAKKSQGFSIF
jgi:hypothetical protein